MNFWDFWSLVFLTWLWIVSASGYCKKPNFVDAFDTVLCGLATVGYLGVILFIK